jgi:hypothetical protein
MPRIEKRLVGVTEQTYVPASIPFEQSQRKMPFATRENPDDICGVAVRVGWAGTRESDPPIYRLKLKTSLASFKTAVLPGFFVLKQGVFIPCEQWRRHRKR